MRVISLASSSSGNALLVEAGPHRRTKLLVDAGLNDRLLVERLNQVGVQPAEIRGVLVTHEHSDHILGLPLFMKRYAIPVFANAGTCAALEDGLNSGPLVASNTEVFVETQQEICASVDSIDAGAVGRVSIHEIVHLKEDVTGLFILPVNSFYVLGDIEVLSFPTSHDAAAPCGYLLQAGGCRVCIVTDTGEVTPAMLAAMQLADLLILESNHDRQRLLRGPYPWVLKQRILSPTGHLSNDQAADAVLHTWRADSVRWLWLAHLSRTNNTPALALKSMQTRLQKAGASLSQVHISVLPPGMGEAWDSTQLWRSPSLWDMRV